MVMAWRFAPLVCLFCLILGCVYETSASTGQSVSLQRHKREWIVPPRILEENVDYTKDEYIARIRSDKEDELKGLVSYSIKGIGADEPPVNLFVVDRTNGNVRVTRILDREHIAQYNLSGAATFYNGTDAETDIQLRIKVKDQNDNAPIFTPISPGTVPELSVVGTTVMKIVATDADEPGNPNSQIFYEIIDQKPPGNMFTVNSKGEVLVNNPNLDRETIDQYILTVRASDLNGAVGCKTGTATFKVLVSDVNDNVPTLDQDSFEGSVEENTGDVEVEVMRLKANDLDQPNTNNSLAKFEIVSGNSGGHFRIYTDPKTNEGVLMLTKPVDYEEVKDMNLGIVVSNEAPYHPSVTGAGQTTGIHVGGGGAGAGAGAGTGTGTGTGAGTSWSSGSGLSTGGVGGKVYNMNIKVKNQPEGPRFNPKVKAIPISEEGKIDLTKVITRYNAIDGDTGLPAERVSYVKSSDRDNWLTIDEKTGDIKLNKVPDRESPYLVNGTYMAEILCISQDMPSKTATGTVAIQVEDFNDHCPTLTSQKQIMCTLQEAIYVTAVDKDFFPNSAPFKFAIIPEETTSKWEMEHFNDTTVVMKPIEPLWPGIYKVTLEVRDQQGVACPDRQVLNLDVCTCEKEGVCLARGAHKKSAILGGAGIGLMLLGLLMLLLIPLLLLCCKCGGGTGFVEMPFDTKEHLMNYNTEGQGEDRDVPPYTDLDYNMGKGSIGAGGGFGAGAGIGAAAFGSGMAGMGASYMSSMNGGGHAMGSGHMEMMSMEQRMAGGLGTMRGEYESGMALSDNFLHGYYSEKSQNLDAFAPNNILSYEYEGKGSPAGSVGCCSLLESDNDLEFLNNLGTKFTTLAEICGGTRISMSAPSPLPPPPKPIVNSKSMSIQASTSNIENQAAETARAVSSSASMHTEGNVMVQTNHAQTLIDVIPTQTLMVQQQPLYYMVEPQVTNTVLLAESPAVGLTQGMYMMNGGPVAETVLVQGAVPAQSSITGGDRVMFLETHGGTGQALNTGLRQSASLSGSQLLLVDRGAQSGQVLHGTLQKGSLTGSQGVMLVDGQGGAAMHGSLKSGVTAPAGSVRFIESHGSLPVGVFSSAGSHNGAYGMNMSYMNTFPSTQTVEVQERKVVTSQKRAG